MARRFFFLLCFTAFCTANAWALCLEYRAAMHAKLLSIYYKHPKYVLGGTLDKGSIDCSELIRTAAHQAGIPGAHRKVRACDIHAGQHPWGNEHVPAWEIGDNEECDLLFQHIPNGLNRPGGINHVLTVVTWNGTRHIMHASSSKKTVVIIPFSDWIQKHLVEKGYRRMILGDERKK